MNFTIPWQISKVLSGTFPISICQVSSFLDQGVCLVASAIHCDGHKNKSICKFSSSFETGQDDALCDVVLQPG